MSWCLNLNDDEAEIILIHILSTDNDKFVTILITKRFHVAELFS